MGRGKEVSREERRDGGGPIAQHAPARGRSGVKEAGDWLKGGRTYEDGRDDWPSAFCQPGLTWSEPLADESPECCSLDAPPLSVEGGPAGCCCCCSSPSCCGAPSCCSPFVSPTEPPRCCSGAGSAAAQSSPRPRSLEMDGVIGLVAMPAPRVKAALAEWVRMCGGWPPALVWPAA